MRLSSLIILLFVIVPSFSAFGLYSLGAMNYTSSTFQCIKNTGITQMAFFLPHSTFNGNLDQVLAALMNAKNVGLKVDLLYMACREVSPYEIVNNLKKLNFIGIDRYWITPHNFTADCGWVPRYTAAENCQYMEQLRNQMYRNNLPFGITSNSATWNSIFGTSCNIFANEMLYWFLYPNINSDSTLTHFVPFGGWYTAQMKSYTCTKVCNLDSSTNFCNNIFSNSP